MAFLRAGGGSSGGTPEIMYGQVGGGTSTSASFDIYTATEDAKVQICYVLSLSGSSARNGTLNILVNNTVIDTITVTGAGVMSYSSTEYSLSTDDAITVTETRSGGDRTNFSVIILKV